MNISTSDAALFSSTALSRLPELAGNIWWSWNPIARQLFASIDPPLWRLTHHNPIHLLKEVDPEHLSALAKQPGFQELYAKTLQAYDQYMSDHHHWCAKQHPNLMQAPIAYFSAEFGLHNSIPLYSGGLGVLAGDHIKEASDLGLSFIGVSFLYSQSYFRQVIDCDGRQQAVYEPFNRTLSPLQPVLDTSGAQCRIDVALGARTVTCLLWKLPVGRASLLLLDTDTPENTPADCSLSSRLYGGDATVRLCQEMLLGIGGVRALQRCGIQPQFWHMNEGHAAFLNLERIREAVQSGLTFQQAKNLTSHASLFTTHTPVAAGHDIFPIDLIDEHFSGYWEQLDLSRNAFLDLGRHPELPGDCFHMTALAIRLSRSRNGVSLQHAQVSKQMWRCLWPQQPVDHVPITHVTNGIHIPTWVAPEIRRLFDKYLGEDWIENADDPAMWDQILAIPDQEIWEVRRLLKRKLLNFIRQRIQQGWRTRHLTAIQTLAEGALLDPFALTIGFGRRFATYKRATLLFSQPERLQRLLKNPRRPIQFIFAGKAHPADELGQRFIQEVYQACQNPNFGGRIAFLENYDMHIAKFLIQGVDVWLNNPRPPMEASGTSGQKAAVNGIPNLSVLDGWWKEGYDGINGWALPPAPENADTATQDAHDANALFDLLEQQVIPTYFSRDDHGIPHGWVSTVKQAIRSNAPRFSTKRMVKEYVELFYDSTIPTDEQA